MRVREIRVFLFALVSLVMAAGSAQAITLDPSGPSIALKSGEDYSYQFNTTTGNFLIDHKFEFTAPIGLTTLTTSIALNSDPLKQGQKGIKSLTVAWFDSSDNQMGSSLVVTNNLGQVLDTGALLTVVLTSSPLYLWVGGTTLANGGFYDLNFTATPLPPALILFGSALAGLTWLSRRRRRVNAAL